MIAQHALILVYSLLNNAPPVEHPIASVTRIAAASGLALVLMLSLAAWIGWMRRRRPILERVIIRDPDHNTSHRG
jgi:hypothetical protein